ncbi:hypothetical protein FQA39_LY00065 [Lamprigera yunnana]|nr:hypothetical protein FQA39_LY00065 [Lamprigera yunnana]
MPPPTGARNESTSTAHTSTTGFTQRINAAAKKRKTAATLSSKSSSDTAYSDMDMDPTPKPNPISTSYAGNAQKTPGLILSTRCVNQERKKDLAGLLSLLGKYFTIIIFGVNKWDDCVNLTEYLTPLCVVIFAGNSN